jgi:alginate O-acetyltransferase complex protein AlgJ
MRVFCALALLCFFETGLAAEPQTTALSENQEKFRAELAAKFQAAEKANSRVVAGADGWLFLPGELRSLSVGRFWGDEAAKVSRSPKPEKADPIPAILDFRDQLRQHGIELLLVPVPPKAAIYPEKIVPKFRAGTEDAAPYLHGFYDELRAKGVEVVDLTTVFLQHRETEHGPAFCKIDSHWSGSGCVLAAQTIAERARAKLKSSERIQYDAMWKDFEVSGDLAGLVGSDTQKPTPEKISLRYISEKTSGAGVQPDANSPLLLLGDSHTLVFHEFFGERGGLLDQLAYELGFAPDLIGTRGSGATAVRISLYRRSNKDPTYLTRKKMVIWCFSAREFTEADGWEKVPVSK